MKLRARRLLLFPAAALVLLGTPALALDQPSPTPPSVTDVALPIADASGPGAQAVVHAPADLVGVKWDGDQAAQFRIEVRRAGSSTWEPAATVAQSDAGADTGSPDGRSSTAVNQGANVSDPIAVEGTTAVRVTVVSGTVSDVTVSSVVSGVDRVPAGSAGAWGASVPGAPTSTGYALALVGAGLVLVVVAAGWSPWRSRRTMIALGVAGVLTLVACVPPPPETGGSTAPQPTIITRAEWGARPFSTSDDCLPGPVIAPSLKFAVVHHTVTGNTDSWGYCDIAYNFLLDRYGQIFEGRAGGIDKAVVAAHAGGFNTSSTGIALLGTFTSEQPTAAQWDALVRLLAWKLSTHHVDPSLGFTTTAGNFGGSQYSEGTVVTMANAIIGHRDVDMTECPGAAFYPRLPELRNAVQPRIGWTNNPTTTTTSTPTTTVAPPTTTSTLGMTALNNAPVPTTAASTPPTTAGPTPSTTVAKPTATAAANP